MVEGTASETGTAFFRALVRNLAAVMDTAGAWVVHRAMKDLGDRLDGKPSQSVDLDIQGEVGVRSVTKEYVSADK